MPKYHTDCSALFRKRFNSGRFVRDCLFPNGFSGYGHIRIRSGFFSSTDSQPGDISACIRTQIDLHAIVKHFNR